jgi:hypothetical protein
MICTCVALDTFEQINATQTASQGSESVELWSAQHEMPLGAAKPLVVLNLLICGESTHPHCVRVETSRVELNDTSCRPTCVSLYIFEVFAS